MRKQDTPYTPFIEIRKVFLRQQCDMLRPLISSSV